ncbi:ABC transporter [Pediococcus acidilactici]
MKLELRQWRRKQRLVLMLLIAALMGLAAPLTAYYSNQLVQKFGEGNVASIQLPAPTWDSLLASYFQSTEQVVLFIMAYLVADACTLGKNPARQFFYLSRAKKANTIYFPKIVAGLVCVLLSSVMGAGMALYVDWVCFSGTIRFELMLPSLMLEIMGILGSVILASTVAIYLSAPFLAAGLIEIMVLVSSLVSQLRGFAKWSPTIFLNPVKWLSQPVYWADLWRPLLIWGILVGGGLFLIAVKPLQHRQAMHSVEEGEG